MRGPAARIAVRLLAAIPTLFGALVLTFLLLRVLPGDPAVTLAANPSMSAVDIAEVRRDLGLDLPLTQQFTRYLGQIARGDLGRSTTTGEAVTTELARRLPASAELALAALVLAAALALPLGAGAALRPGSALDHAARGLAALGIGLPTFVSGLLLLLVFYYLLGWAPEPIGRLDPFVFEPPRITGFLTIDAALAGDGAAFRSALGHLALPAATLGLFALAPVVRMLRASMRATLDADFIRAARTLGLSRRRIVLTYAFRNAMLPVVTTLGMTFSYLLGASVLVEQVFAWPGVGAFAVACIVNLDHAPVQGFVLLMAGSLMAVNLLTDIAAALVDPRVAQDRAP